MLYVSWSRIVFGLFVLAAGITWLGNELKWWDIPFPFWPVVAVVVGVALLAGAVQFRKRKDEFF